MKPLKRALSIAAAVAALSLAPAIGWGTRVFPDQLSGTLTATPASDTIEVDHRIYHVKPGSLAAQELRGLYEGQRVEVVLDGPPAGKSSTVVKITLHPNE